MSLVVVFIFLFFRAGRGISQTQKSEHRLVMSPVQEHWTLYFKCPAFNVDFVTIYYCNNDSCRTKFFLSMMLWLSFPRLCSNLTLCWKNFCVVCTVVQITKTLSDTWLNIHCALYLYNGYCFK